MCKRKPGPRCTPHAKQALDRARDAYLQANTAPDSTPEQVRAALQNVAEKQRIYNSTPGGQRELEAAIAETGSDDERQTLEAALSRGREERQQQAAAYQAAERSRNDDSGQPGAPGHRSGEGSVPEAPRTGPGQGDDGDEPPGVRRDGHRDGDPPRVLINDTPVTPIGSVDPPPERSAVHQDRGIPTPTVYELGADDAGHFRDAISALKEGNPFHASVHVYEEGEYARMRMFVTDDGTAGFALAGDDVVSVFSRKDGAHSGSASSMLATAVDNGGRRLDCFDTVLPKLYAQEGFAPSARVPWDDEFAPDGWDYSTYEKYNGGRPDVVLMTYDPDRVDDSYDPEAGDSYADYDDAAAVQRDHVDRINQRMGK